jgi:peptidoglycan DL-endopeptidase CwlO
MAKHALKPVHSTQNKMKLMIPIVVAGTILSTAAIAQADTGNHNLQPAAQGNIAAFQRVSDTSSQVVSAPITAKLTFERPAVTSTPAPKPVAPPVAAVAPDATAPAPATTTPDIAQIAAAAVSPTDPANIPAALGGVGAATNGTGATDAFGAKIAAAAIAQVGIEQDCTSLVSNSLLAVGIKFHGWPADYMNKLGTVTTSPTVGDIIYYRDGGTGVPHVAIFIGNGLAVHGGWEGHTTKIFSVNVGSGPIYVHVKR